MMKRLLKEFESFAVRGNALDLAVGVVIGAAFGQVTNSLSTNVLSPIVGLLLGGLNFSQLAVPLGGDATITYGIFLQTVLNFIIIAFVLFGLVKLVNRVAGRAPATKDGPPPEKPEVALLREIRDELRKPGAGEVA